MKEEKPGARIFGDMVTGIVVGTWAVFMVLAIVDVLQRWHLI